MMISQVPEIKNKGTLLAVLTSLGGQGLHPSLPLTSYEQRCDILCPKATLEMSGLLPQGERQES